MKCSIASLQMILMGNVRKVALLSYTSLYGKQAVLLTKFTRRDV